MGEYAAAPLGDEPSHSMRDAPCEDTGELRKEARVIPKQMSGPRTRRPQKLASHGAVPSATSISVAEGIGKRNNDHY